MADRLLCAGEPPRWTPLPGSNTLRKDSSSYFRDKNAARFRSHPVEPGVMVALATDPDLPQRVDVVACGSTLGNLLRYVRGQDKKFRILVQIVQNTMFFIRRENSPTDLIEDVRGYGHTFPEAYTTWSHDVRGSASHQRLMQYDFGGLHLLVRFEGDGFVAPPDWVPGLEPSISPAPTHAVHNIDSLTESLGRSKVSPEISSTTAKLVVKHAGRLVGQSHVFDLKTRSIKRKGEDFLADELPRLWLAQIPKFVLAFHDRGRFELAEIPVRDIEADVLKWERDHETELALLAALIHRIISLSRSQPGKKLELLHERFGILEVREQLPDAGDVLSAEAREAWCGNKVDEPDCKTPELGGQTTHATVDEPDDIYETFDGELDAHDQWDDEDKDFTACSVSCGYCGHCNY